MSTLALGWAIGLGTLALGLAIAAALWRQAAPFAASAIEAAVLEANPPPLAPGPITLRGVVRRDDGEPAIEVRIVQAGREWRGKKRWHQSWREVSRRTQVRSFWLDLPGNEGSVWVQPSTAVVLADDLDILRRPAIDRRVRIARLTSGESVSVTGTLARGSVPGGMGDGYRGEGPSGWVLEAGPGAMLSTHDLSDVGRRWSTHLRRWAFGTLLATLVFQAFYASEFYLPALRGEGCDAEVVDRETTEDGDELVILEGACTPESVAVATYDLQSDPALGDLVPLWVMPDGSVQLGGPGAPMAVAGNGLLVAIALVLFYGAQRRRELRWWNGVPVSETEPGKFDPGAVDPSAEEDEPSGKSVPPAFRFTKQARDPDTGLRPVVVWQSWRKTAPLALGGLSLFALVSMCIASAPATNEPMAMVAAALLVASTYGVLALAFNETTLEISSARLVRRHGPLPWLGGRTVELTTFAPRDVVLAPRGSALDVVLRGKGQPLSVLVVMNRASALFVGHRVANALGIPLVRG